MEDIIKNIKVPRDGATLFISDLGYFKVETYKTLALQKRQFFLSKLKSNVTVLDEEGKKVNIKKIVPRGIDVLESKVYMGGVPCRLAIQKLPDDVVNRKLRDAHRKA